jgi:predicted murein hydrolase (TIGR00659 family)
MSDVSVAALAVVSTIVVYAGAVALYQATRSFLLNPVLVSIVVLAAALALLDIPHSAYDRGGRLLAFLLGPAVVALGVPLYRQSRELLLRRRALGIAVTAGSAIGVLSGTLTALLLGAPADVARSLSPRSVTTPIAIEISAGVGGIPALTAVLVIASGVLGAVVGPAILRAAGVRSRTAVGFALGAAAHGIGTVRAAEEGAPETASAGLAIGLMGIATALWAPLILWVLASAGWL